MLGASGGSGEQLSIMVCLTFIPHHAFLLITHHESSLCRRAACALLSRGTNNVHPLWGWYAASVSDDGGVHSIAAYDRAISALGLSQLSVAPLGPPPPLAVAQKISSNVAVNLVPLYPNPAGAAQRRAQSGRWRRRRQAALLRVVHLLG